MNSIDYPSLLVRIRVATGLLAFSLTAASAQNLIIITNLVSFNGTNGQQPSGQLLQAWDGNLYGTTLYGGTNSTSSGTVFRISTSGVFTNLIFFNGANGANPNSGLIQDAAGNLFGTTTYGGAYTNIDPSHNGFGTVFKITTNGVLTTLASFDGHAGKSPNAIIQTSPDVFYGSANSGGAYSNFAGYGFGTVFEANTNGLLTNVLSFNDSNGATPTATLMMTPDGTLYGTTSSGGAYEYGIAFRLAVNGSIAVQHSFDYTNGADPGLLIRGRDGNLYGTAIFGGSNRAGTIFKLTTNLAMTTLVTFNGTNGDAPTALIQGTDGNFYGLTAQGGAHGFGNIFQLTTNGVLTPLYQFTGGADGYAASSLIQGNDGSFYGATSYGGNAGRGNIFKLTVIPAPTIHTVVLSAHAITFTWTAVSGMTYDVQCCANLNRTNWSHLKTVTASSAIGTASDTIGADSHKFYRVALLSTGSAPLIQNVFKSGNSISFAWTATPGMTYDIQYTTNIALTPWSKLKSVIASNVLCTVTDAIGPDRQRFYRVAYSR